jgi:hypothetical protein
MSWDTVVQGTLRDRRGPGSVSVRILNRDFRRLSWPNASRFAVFIQQSAFSIQQFQRECREIAVALDNSAMMHQPLATTI